MPRELIISRSPQNPDDVIVSFAEADVADIDDAVARAVDAQKLWAAFPAPMRANVLAQCGQRLDDVSAELIELGIREVGKPRSEMVGEVARASAILRYFSQQVLDPDGYTFPSPDGRSLLFARHRPHGVVGCITPWNFPVAIPIWKSAPALAFGNAVILKPAPQSLATALRIEDIFNENLPEGLFQVIAGDASAGRALLARVDAVSFTGSIDVGRSVVVTAAQHGIPVQAEMGGLNASIILEDADPERAARMVALACMGFAGQKCTATSRIIVVGDPRPFTEAVVSAIEDLPFGEPSDDITIVGPLIDSTSRDAVLQAMGESQHAGARLLTGGEVPGGRGYFVRPVLLDRVTVEMRVAQEEIFGPIATLISVPDVERAISVANDVRYGLAAAIFTNDLDRAITISSALDVGLVKLNAPTTGVDFYAPFGGAKASSYGAREQGKSARDFFTWSQTFTLTPNMK